MDCYGLAHQLGKSVEEIKQMKIEDFTMWRAYFDLIRPKEEKNAQNNS